MGSVAESKVAGIVQSLSSLEDDLDSLNSRVADMKRQLAGRAQAEIDRLLEQTRKMASEEAQKIIDSSREKAGAESARISQEGEARLAEIHSKTGANFDEAVKYVVSAVLKA